ncbi:hypothetical protein ACE01N_19570 [Saccharicrinis sp. FJH2]|uniref:hypothetical protein n=1 Tax=Saccharicrinis sp. FJH65 TaxID=3344659 RepID=UPI0035F2B502
METYNVLIVDDKEPILKYAKDAIRPELTLEGEKYLIDVSTLHVSIGGDDNNESFFIEEETFQKLGELSNKSYDIIFLDFGFVKPKCDILNVLKSKFGDSFGISELEGYVFNPRNLVEQGIKVLNRKHNKKVYTNFIENFVNHKKNIIIYTYISSEWSKYVQNTTLRENITKRTFPQAKNIDLIDTRSEIFDNSKFDSIKKEFPQYYDYIVSKFLENIIHLEISKESIEKAKYIKVKKTTKVLAFLIVFGALIGASTEFFGQLIFKAFEENQYILAISLIVLTIIGILTAGRLLIYLLEKKLTDLIKNE